MGNYLTPKSNVYPPKYQQYHLRKTSHYAGSIYEDTVHWDDKDLEILKLKIRSCKILYQTVEDVVEIKGFIFNFNELFKAKKTRQTAQKYTPKGSFYKEFTLETDEFITCFVVELDHDSITGIIFNTNKQTNLGIASSKTPTKKKTLKFSMENKFIVGCYGGYNGKGLNYIGFYYASLRDFIPATLPYYKLKHRLKEKEGYLQRVKANYEKGLFKKCEAEASFAILATQKDLVFANVILYL
jgi:hypothetical protein